MADIITFPRPWPTPGPGSRPDIVALDAVPLAASAVISAAEAGDPHLGWLARQQRLLDRLDGPSIQSDDDWDDECGELFEVEDRICTTPAATVPGVHAQLQIALRCAETWEGDRNEPVVAALRNAVLSLQQLAGSVGHG